ncbi:hypothetical protein CVD28_04385 [Bacillus sp. M6-12]|uniref:hypothetical protein n=1 Tax=Bacillus sp. M6-12 TaxID=2054166 RepID=UPI000C75A2FD|nr:hypothetical protein [Bacillus sp. M6-12]PLS19660.1 hypothetical protein CVD28_04385 [Bacillus sp. M6-12]
MREYNSVQAINDNPAWRKQERYSFWDFIDSFISSFSKTESLEIAVPKNVYLRTKLLCEYISEKGDMYFGVSDFLLTLYLEFLRTSIEKYNPKKIHEEMTRSHGYNQTLRIYVNESIYEYPKRAGKESFISFTIDKKNKEKGQLLLDEMEDLYGQAPSLEELISNLWVNFIEDYKAGNNKRATNEIIRLMKNSKEALD